MTRSTQTDITELVAAVDRATGGSWAERDSVESFVEAAMEWHFNPETGCRFWIERAASLPFDPRRDIHTIDDLRRFPDVSDEWKHVRVEDLVPRGLDLPGLRPGVYESGGTTGAPKRIVDVAQWARATRYWSQVLDLCDFPRDAGNMLYLGPSGPHVVAHAAKMLAGLRAATFLSVDLDPRFVRRAMQNGLDAAAALYVEHILDQAEWALQSQDVGIMFATPPLLVAIAERPKLAALVAKKVRGIIWGSTSMDPETLTLLRTEVFPDAVIAGTYGNTMMGIAPQRPSVAGDPETCVFQPFSPWVHLTQVDPADPARQVGAGERGQVVLHIVSPDLLLPTMVERDLATRVAPAGGFTAPGVAAIQPSATPGVKVVEGVY